MALVSPKMSLRVWDQFSDPYSHDQLADNWSKVDLHDHTPGRGVQIPTEGIADGAVTGAKLAASNIISTIQVVDGSLLDTDLASPNNTVYKTVAQVGGLVNAGSAAGTYYFTPGANLTGSGVTNASLPVIFPFTTTDYAVANKATVFRLAASWVTNNVAPLSTFTLGMYPITASSGGVSSLGITLGAVVAGSNGALVAAPAATANNKIYSADFSMGASANYAFGMAISVATAAASSLTGFNVLLQVRNV